jgi:hypothetical protein
MAWSPTNMEHIIQHRFVLQSIENFGLEFYVHCVYLNNVKNVRVFFYQQNIKSFLGEEKIQKLINFSLKYLSEITIPIKRYAL